VELRPYPALGKAVSGFWGLVGLDREVPAYAYPPPYLEVASPYRKFLENAVSIRD